MGKLKDIGQGYFHIENNNLKFTNTWVGLIFRNLQDLTYTGLDTLLVVWPFEITHILKADKISVHMTYDMHNLKQFYALPEQLEVHKYEKMHALP